MYEQHTHDWIPVLDVETLDEEILSITRDTLTAQGVKTRVNRRTTTNNRHLGYTLYRKGGYILRRGKPPQKNKEKEHTA